MRDPTAVPRALPSGELDSEARRLLWRCRRGMRELDVLLERFARSHLGIVGAVNRETFARFLELPDPLLADYLLRGAVPAELEFARLTSSIIEQAAQAYNC